MLYLFFPFFIGIFEKYSFYKGHHNKKNIPLMFLTSGVLLFFYQIVFNNNLNFSFIFDFKFWLLLILENFFVYLTLKNFKIQKTYAEVSFVLFNSISLISFLGYIYYFLFHLQVKPLLTFNQNLFLMLYMFFISFLFFYKKKVNNWNILLLYLFLVSNLGFLALYLLKIYSSSNFLLYSIINFSIFFQYLFSLRSSFKKEKMNWKGIFSFCLTNFLVIISVKHTPIVLFYYLKRIGQFNFGLFVDKNFTKKSILINLLLVTGFFILLYFSGFYKK